MHMHMHMHMHMCMHMFINMHQVLRFTTRVHNIGCAPFVIGEPDGWCGLGCEVPGQRRLGTDPTDDSVRVGGFNTSNSFKNGNGHYSGSTKAR